MHIARTAVDDPSRLLAHTSKRHSNLGLSLNEKRGSSYGRRCSSSIHRLSQEGIPVVASLCFARRTAVGVRVMYTCDLVNEARGIGIVPAPMHTRFVAVAPSSTEHDQRQDETSAHNNIEQQQK